MAVVGSGPVSQLSEFADITGYGGRLYADPSRRSFKLLGLTSGVKGLMALKPLTRAYSALRSGFKPGSPAGNILQLGGAVIITPEESVLYFYRSEDIGDDPPVAELLAALP